MYTSARYGTATITRRANGHQFGDVPTPWNPSGIPSAEGGGGGGEVSNTHEDRLNADHARRKVLVAEARKLELYEVGEAQKFFASGDLLGTAEHYNLASVLAYMQAELGAATGCGKGPGGKPAWCEAGGVGYAVLLPKDIAAAEKRGKKYANNAAGAKTQAYNQAKGLRAGAFPGLVGRGAATPSGRGAVTTAARPTGQRVGFTATPKPAGVTPASLVESEQGMSTGAKVAIGVGTAGLAIAAAWYFMG